LNGGQGSIAEQLVDHRIDVTLGGGKQRFDQTIDGGVYTGQTVLESAAVQGYTFVGNNGRPRFVFRLEPVAGPFHLKS